MNISFDKEVIIADKEIAVIENWQNDDNFQYYENIPIQDLRDFAIRGGLEEGCDIDLVYPYISHLKSIMDVGAGYGRALKKIVEKGYLGKIYALERSKNFFRYLNKNFGDKAHIIHADMKDFNFEEKVDALLLMWSNLSEFPKNEQLPILRHISRWLNFQGLLVIETISANLIPKNATFAHNQSYVIHEEYGSVYGYTPTTQEISEYANHLGCKSAEHIPYKTDTNRNRVISILKF